MVHVIIMPDLAQTSGELKILRWLKRPGDRIEQGDLLVEVETDKAVMEVEAYASGYLREVLVNEGEEAALSAPIAVLTSLLDEPYESPRTASTPEPGALAAPPSVEPTPGLSSRGIAAAPAARVRARDLGVDLTQVTGSGPGGLITRADVERYAASFQTVAAPPMAAWTVASKQTIPHFYVSREVNLEAAAEWRTAWNGEHTEKASWNDVLVRAASMALLAVPECNRRFDNGRLEAATDGHLMLIVATSSGLLPVTLASPASLPWKEYLGLSRLAIESAREGRVRTPSTDARATLAVSNLGMFGIQQFAAIIPPSCTAILAIGAVERRPAIASDGQICARTQCTLTLSADHRVLDGVLAARFLEATQKSLDSL